ncbi:MAG: long-chain-fatty-acid--CoA ligase [Alphaproteobacteria bacterium]|nr:long-chain-fatty-acid--CoA ligase [Alphaproteobacteria bacterium]
MNEPATSFDIGLEKGEANYKALSPLSFLKRSAHVYPDKVAVIHGDRRYTYAEFYARCRRLASALAVRGIGEGDTVSVMAPNIPEMLECHFAVPMLGAVLNAINIRLDAPTVGFILEHGEARAVITDRQFSPVMAEALAGLVKKPLTIDIDDVLAPSGELIGETDYESFIAAGDPDFAWESPDDEWRTIALNYTSGTTGSPKGVLYHHRGAYLNAIGNAMTMGVDARSRYLWTLPMFHCNGWTFTWGVTAVGGTHVCLRDVDPAKIFPLIEEHKVTHMCGAPVVLTALIHAPDGIKRRFDHGIDIATGGAAPPSAVIAGMEELGFRVTHLYGMTECMGPSTVCVWQPEWETLPLDERSVLMARQGVNYMTLEDQAIIDPETMQAVPADGETMGELMLKGNTVMKGYLKNEEATEAALRGDWLHTGDLGVMHPNGYIEIKDRSKDIIISGGENISSLEVEEALYKHPDIMEAAVVAAPHERWGETPCAFIALKPGASAVNESDIIAYCRENLAHFKCPTLVRFGDLPKTSTGKIQKFVLREQVGQTT